MKLLFAVDVGTASFKALVAEVHPKKEALQILAELSQPAQGVKRGVIVDVDDAARTLAQLLEQVEGLIGRNVEEAMVSIGGPHLGTRFSRGTIVVSRADGEISKEDVDRVIQQSEAVALPQNRTLLHVIPREFFVDGVGGVKDPIGMQGVRLEVESLLLDAFTPAIRNVQKCFDVVGVKIVSMVASPLAISRVVLSKLDRERGSVAIDIGSDITNIAVYDEGDLVHASVLPIGSAYITNDLAMALKTPVEVAERIKIEAGHAVADVVAKREMVALAQFIEGENEAVSRRYLAEIIEARLSEIFSMVNEDLRKIDRFGRLPGGAVLSGGGARIPGIQDLAKRHLKLSTRVATIDHYKKVLPKSIDSQFFTAAGLVLWAMDSYDRKGGGGSVGAIFKNLAKSFFP